MPFSTMTWTFGASSWTHFWDRTVPHCQSHRRSREDGAGLRKGATTSSWYLKCQQSWRASLQAFLTRQPLTPWLATSKVVQVHLQRLTNTAAQSHPKFKSLIHRGTRQVSGRWQCVNYHQRKAADAGLAELDVHDRLFSGWEWTLLTVACTQHLPTLLLCCSARCPACCQAVLELHLAGNRTSPGKRSNLALSFLRHRALLPLQLPSICDSFGTITGAQNSTITKHIMAQVKGAKS